MLTCHRESIGVVLMICEGRAVGKAGEGGKAYPEVDATIVAEMVLLLQCTSR